MEKDDSGVLREDFFFFKAGAEVSNVKSVWCKVQM
jgi:hypothetical protein